MPNANVPGGVGVGFGSPWLFSTAPTMATVQTLNAVNKAISFIGHMYTSDGASHTINTTGSSAIGWQAGTVTFANAGTTVKVGIGSVDTATGPVGRATNSSGVITMDVSASFTGGGGGIAAGWNNSVPTAGTKTIANGDLVAVSLQMTAFGGADSVIVQAPTIATQSQEPLTSTFDGTSTYAAATNAANFVVVFSDGAFGHFIGAEAISSILAQNFNSGTSPSEYGQLYQFPFPVRVSGAAAVLAPGGDFTLNLYSDPLGTTPVASKTISFDVNVTAAASSRKYHAVFSSPYDVPPNTPFAIVLTPTTVTNITSGGFRLSSATHRALYTFGTSGYGVKRNGGTGAFTNANTSLDHYFLLPIIGGLNNPAEPTYILGM